MTMWTTFGVGLGLLAGLANPLLAQVPGASAPAAAAATPGTSTAATGGQTIWKFFGLSRENLAGCKDKFCQSQLGMMANNFMKPVNTFAGGLFPSCCPPVRAADLAKPADSAEGAAARIKQDEQAAKARREAVRYLGTVDCRYWPEAQEGLINALRADRNECVRLEAALALGRGCCCNKATIKALTLTVTGSQEDGNPAECSERVKAAAAGALQHCLACLPVEPQQPEPLLEKPHEGEKPRDLPSNGKPAPTGNSSPPATSRTNGTNSSSITANQLTAIHHVSNPANTAVPYYKRVDNVPLTKLVEQAKAGLLSPTTSGIQPSRAEGGLVGIIMDAMDRPNSREQRPASAKTGAPATGTMRNAEYEVSGLAPATLDISQNSKLITQNPAFATHHPSLTGSNLKSSLFSSQPITVSPEPSPLRRFGFAWHSFKNRLLGKNTTSGAGAVTQGLIKPGKLGYIDGPPLVVDGASPMQTVSGPTLQQPSQGTVVSTEKHLEKVVHHPSSVLPRTPPPPQQIMLPSPALPQRRGGTIGAGPILVQRSGEMAIDSKPGQPAQSSAVPQAETKPAEVTPASMIASVTGTPSIRKMVTRALDPNLPVASCASVSGSTEPAKADRTTGHPVSSLSGPELFPGKSGPTVSNTPTQAPTLPQSVVPTPTNLPQAEALKVGAAPVPAGEGSGSKTGLSVSATEVARLTTLLTISVDPRTRETAANGLAVADWKANPQVVSALLTRAQHDPDPRVRVACISSLAEMKADSPAVMNGLHQLQFDRNLDVVREARKAMNRLRIDSTTGATLLFSR